MFYAMDGIRTQLFRFLLVLLVAFSFSSAAVGDEGLYWVVVGDYRVSDAVKNTKYRTIKEACEAGVSGKEKYWGARGYKFRSLGGIDARKNPETGANGGPYSSGNWGLKPGDPGFVDSSRTFYCNHEYKKPNGSSWSTYWPYSGADVSLRGYGCSPGMVWDSGTKSCIALGTKSCPNPSSRTPNPIDTATGIKYYEIDDFAGSARFPVPFKRYYSTETSSWTYTFSRNVHLKRGGDRVIVRRDSGSALKFKKTTEAWVSVSHTTARLEELASAGERVGWRFTDGDTIETFNQSGQLLTVHTPELGTFEINREGQEMTVVAPGGATITLTFDASNRLRAFENPNGDLFRYVFDGASGISKLKKVLYPNDEPDPTPHTILDNPGRIYLYENTRFPGYITGIEDAFGNRVATVDYDAQGRATLSELADGVERVTVSYNDDGSTTITNALGKETTYKFVTQDKKRLLAEVEGHPSANCGGAAKSYTYTPEGWLETRTDWNGMTTRFVYNSSGRIIQEIQAEGLPQERRIIRTWHETLDKVTNISGPLKIIDLDYDDLGRLTNRQESDVSSPRYRQWAFSYHDAQTTENADVPGKLASVDGPRESVPEITSYEYDTHGNLLTVENALGHKVEYSNHDSIGRANTVVDANGVTTELTYDYRGNITRVAQTSQVESVTSYEYDLEHRLKKVTLPDGSSLDYTYGAARRLTSVEDNLGNRIEFTHDAMGNVTAETAKDASGNVTRKHQQVFDELGRLMRSIRADSVATRYGYDKNSNLTSIIDGNSLETRRAYDALDRLSQITDPLGGQVTFTYDAADNLTSVTDQRGLKTEYEYNFAGEMIARHSPDTGTTTLERDTAGNVIRKTDARGVITEYSYDALNRLTEVLYPGAPEENIVYSYDDTANGNKGIGRLTGISDQSGTLAYRYDALGNVTEVNRTIEGQSYTTAYRYDLASNLTGITYPSGRIVTYTRNAVGEVSAITTQEDAAAPEQVVVQDVTYLPFGPMKQLAYGNGLVRDVSYNQDYQITGINSGAVQRTYDYDQVDNIQSITDLLDPAQTQTFQYDALSRLTQATGAYGQVNYRYDGVGNRLSRERAQDNRVVLEEYTYASTSNQLESVVTDDDGVLSERQLSYSPVGNIDQDQQPDHQRSLIYNQQNRLEEVQQNGEVLALYIYNALGQRVIKVATDPEQNLHFHYDQAGRLIAETGPDGSTHRELIYLNGVPVAVFLGKGQVEEPPVEPVDELIVDNLSPGVTTTGSWPASTSVSTYFESNYAFHASGAGSNRFAWNPQIEVPGVYRVYAHWTSHPNRASDAKYDIQAAGEKIIVTVDQTKSGGRWVDLGAFNLDATANVSISDKGDGYVVADAIKLVRLGDSLPEPIISDNDGANTRAEGAWGESSYSPGYEGAGYRFHPPGQGGNVFIWEPPLPQAGVHRVYAKWTSHSNRASNATYTLQTESGSVAVEVDQRISGGTWQLLGSYDLGEAFKVELSDDADGYVIADAIKIEPLN